MTSPIDNAANRDGSIQKGQWQILLGIAARSIRSGLMQGVPLTLDPADGPVEARVVRCHDGIVAMRFVTTDAMRHKVGRAIERLAA